MAIIDLADVRRAGRHAGVSIGARLCRALSLPALAVGLGAAPAQAQTAPAAQPVAALIGFNTGDAYTYDVKLPAAALAALEEQRRRGYYAEEQTVTINGRPRKVVATVISWPNVDYINDSGFAWMKSATSTAIDRDDQWVNFKLGGDAAWKASAAKMQAASTATPYGWRILPIRYLVREGGDPETITVPLSGDEKSRRDIDTKYAAFRSEMATLSEATVAGSYFSEAQVPTRIDQVRRKMLDYGNEARLAPGFRRLVGAKVATEVDLSKPFGSVTKIRNLEGGEEPVFEQPNMQLDPEMNKLAQWQAEALAAGKGKGHDYSGPPVDGNPMTTLGDRVRYFKIANCCAEIMGAGPVGVMPYGWMAGDTHYRWHFGVDGRYPLIGYGAAKGKDGLWYYIGVSRGSKS